jgi:hypothetical protein
MQKIIKNIAYARGNSHLVRTFRNFLYAHSRPAIILLASVFLVGIYFLSYNLTHAAPTITLNINDGELIVDDVPKSGTPTPFSLTTQTTTANTLGYALSAYATAPAITDGNVTIAKDAGNNDCTTTVPLSTTKSSPTEIEVTTSENISSTLNTTITIYCAVVTNDQIPDGEYDVTIGYHLAENRPVATATPQWVKSSTTVAGATATNITVDKDPNMIPIVNKQSDGTYPAVWCNYDQQQWCNAVTVNPSYLATAQNTSIGTEIPEDQILGYWVYIPRYAYEVQRHSAIDTPIPTQTPFDIRFEKATDGKKSPAPTCSTGTPGDGVTTNHKDYRTACGIDRTYPGATTTSNTTTWSTHPAFTFGTQELNGLWVGKYETGTDFSCYNTIATTPANCGENVAPDNIYIKPGQSPMVTKYVGVMFRIANNMGTTQTTGGNTITNNTSTNTMNLAATNTHQQKNSEWGAVVYLSTSIFGVYGTNNVFNSEGYADSEKKVYNNGFHNSAITTNTAHVSTYDTATTRHMTGCGPVSDKSDDYNTTCNQYHTTLGQTASTTGNVYGLYDIAGGTLEYVMGLRDNAPSSPVHMATLPPTDYYDNYPVPPFGTQPAGSDTIEEHYGFDICNYQYCGGHSLHETVSVQSVLSNFQLWGSDYTRFMDANNSWFLRGGSSQYGFPAGAFAVARDAGNTLFYDSWRAVGISAQSVF